MYDWVFNAAGSTTPHIQQGSLSSTESSNENSSFQFQLLVHVFSMVLVVDNVTDDTYRDLESSTLLYLLRKIAIMWRQKWE